MQWSPALFPYLTLTDSHLKVVDFFHLHCLSVAQPFHWCKVSFSIALIIACEHVNLSRSSCWGFRFSFPYSWFLHVLTDSHLKVVDFFHLHCLSVAQPFHWCKVSFSIALIIACEHVNLSRSSCWGFRFSFPYSWFLHVLAGSPLLSWTGFWQIITLDMVVHRFAFSGIIVTDFLVVFYCISISTLT